MRKSIENETSLLLQQSRIDKKTKAAEKRLRASQTYVRRGKRQDMHQNDDLRDLLINTHTGSNNKKQKGGANNSGVVNKNRFGYGTNPNSSIMSGHALIGKSITSSVSKRSY